MIRENKLEDFTRKARSLNAYREFCYNVERKFGSILNYMLEERLPWDSGSDDTVEVSFEDPSKHPASSTSSSPTN